MFRDESRKLTAKAARHLVLMDDERAARLLDRLQDRIEIERIERAKIEHVRLDATFVREFFGCLQREVGCVAIGDDRKITTFATQTSLTEWDQLVIGERHGLRLWIVIQKLWL